MTTVTSTVPDPAGTVAVRVVGELHDHVGGRCRTEVDGGDPDEPAAGDANCAAAEGTALRRAHPGHDRAVGELVGGRRSGCFPDEVTTWTSTNPEPGGRDGRE